jgi:predicted MFS family arabinose efflux permease
MDQELHYSSATMGTITAFGQIIAIAASLMLPKLLQKRSGAWVLIAATVGLSLSLVLLSTSKHWTMVTLGRLGVLVTTALWLPTLQVYQMETVDESWRGIAYGAMSMAMGLGFATMSYSGGFVIAARSYSTIFTIGAITSTIAAVLMFVIKQRNKKNDLAKITNTL